MEISVLNQIYTLVYSVVLGFFFGAFYDFIRILRIFLGINYVNKFTERLSRKKLKFIKNPISKRKNKGERYKKIILFITDILYFLFITPVFAIFLYYQNFGLVRWYALLGLTLGFCSYYFSVGRLVISVSEYIVFYMRISFLYIVFFITRPFIPLVRLCKKEIHKIKSKYKEKKAIKREAKAKSHRTVMLAYGNNK
jgi:hypothetical protein